MRVGIYPYGSGNGIDVYCTELGDALVGLGLEVVAIGPEEPTSDAIEWVEMSRQERHPLVQNRRRAAALDDLFETERLDVLHMSYAPPAMYMRHADRTVVNAWFYPAYSPRAIVARYTSQPVSWRDRPFSLYKQLQYHYMDARAYRAAGAVVAMTRVLHDELVDHGHDAAYLPPGIAADRLGGATPDDPPVPFPLVFAAGDVLDPRKGFDRLLRALDHLRQTTPGTAFALHVAGGNADRAGELVAGHDLTDHVTFHGRLPREELLDLYGRVGALVVPSEYEEFGYVTLEGMARGLPVVGSDIHAFQDLLGDGAGVLVDTTDVGEFSTALRTVIEDDDLRVRTGTAARRRVEREFRWDVLAPRLLDVYAQVADGGTRSIHEATA